MQAGGTSPNVVKQLVQDPFKDPLDPFMDAGRRTASANGDTDATQAWRHMCVSALKRLLKQLGRQACCDRALGLFRTHEEPRSIVQSRTIERRVLVTNCARRRSQRDDRGGQAGPVVDAHARDARTGAGAPPSTRCHTARSVPLVGGHRRITTPLLPHTPSTHPSPLRHHSAWRRLRTGEEPRSIVQTRTIERRVLGDIGGQTIEFVGRLEAIQQDLRSIGTREVLVQVRGLRRRQGGHAAPAVPLR